MPRPPFHCKSAGAGHLLQYAKTLSVTPARHRCETLPAAGEVPETVHRTVSPQKGGEGNRHSMETLNKSLRPCCHVPRLRKKSRQIQKGGFPKTGSLLFWMKESRQMTFRLIIFAPKMPSNEVTSCSTFAGTSLSTVSTIKFVPSFSVWPVLHCPV